MIPDIPSGQENFWTTLNSLQRIFKLPILPWRIDGFDISHTSGNQTVGVVVVFEQGYPNPSLYRKFNIKSVEGIDDFRSMAADKCRTEDLNFMIRNARGLVCVPISAEQAEKLDLVPMVEHNTDAHGTMFTVSVDHSRDTTTGISAAERAITARALADPDSKPDDFHRPGHIFPLIARPGGVLHRAGHTEAAVDLARLAGLHPAGTICEITKEDGSMRVTIAAGIVAACIGFCQKVTKGKNLRFLYFLVGLGFSLFGPRIAFIEFSRGEYFYLSYFASLAISTLWVGIFPILFQEIDEVPGLCGLLLTVSWALVSAVIFTATQNLHDASQICAAGLVFLVVFWSRHVHDGNYHTAFGLHRLYSGTSVLVLYRKIWSADRE